MDLVLTLYQVLWEKIKTREPTAIIFVILFKKEKKKQICRKII